MDHYPNQPLFLSARIKHCWQRIMDAKGWQDYCESTTTFSWISYAYTNDAPEDCVKTGELLWAELIHSFGGVDQNGLVVQLGQAPMSCVTRRSELWAK